MQQKKMVCGLNEGAASKWMKNIYEWNVTTAGR